MTTSKTPSTSHLDQHIQQTDLFKVMATYKISSTSQLEHLVQHKAILTAYNTTSKSHLEHHIQYKAILTAKKKKHQHQQFHNKPHLTGKHTRICKCAFVENTRPNLPLSTRRYMCLLPYTYVCTNQSATAAALCGTYSSERVKGVCLKRFLLKR